MPPANSRSARNSTTPRRFPKGWQPCANPGHWGFADATGKIIINPQFDEAKSFTNGVAWVKTGQFGYVDQTGKYVWNPTK